MAAFQFEGKVELTIFIDGLGGVCYWEMFSSQLGTMHISKDGAYDDNNNVMNLYTKF
jgi:hypothetical protein